MGDTTKNERPAAMTVVARLCRLGRCSKCMDIDGLSPSSHPPVRRAALIKVSAKAERWHDPQVVAYRPYCKRSANRRTLP